MDFENKNLLLLSRFVAPSLFPGPRFPPHLAGPAYLMSGPTVRRLLAATGAVRLLLPGPLEDVYTTGLLAAAAGIDRLHHPHFHTGRRRERRLDACADGDVTIHHVDPDMMTECHWVRGSNSEEPV